MRAIDKVLEIFLQGHLNRQLTTKEIANQLGLTRGVVSSYLSQLFKEGKLEKAGTRPVYWSLRTPETAFEQIIGSKGSLSSVIEQSRESIIYPHGGFPLLITGNSGVGKSFLAKTIFLEAKRLGVVNQDANFVTLNAADYANNPELLSSVLFGYKKGAFTGALVDKLGLVDRADGGYLFLDEVHRLPHSSQEKLFSLLDSDSFYPLGESDHPRKVNVRFIFATTENVDHILLKTLLRRIPLRVHLPDYIDRPLPERLSVVINAFQNEAIRVNRAFEVPLSTVSTIVNMNLPGNVGGIQNEVTLQCAKAFAANDNLADPIRLDYSAKNTVVVTPDKKTGNQLANLVDHLTGLDDVLLQAIGALNQSLKNQEALSEQEFIVHKLLRNVDRNVDNFMLPGTKATLCEAYKRTLHDRYGLEVSGNDDYWSKVALMWTFIQFVKMDDKRGRLAELQVLLKRRFPRSMYLLRQFVLAVDNHLRLSGWPLLLIPLLGDKLKTMEDVGFNALLLAHGPSTASSIQSVVNNLCGGYYFEAFDMPVDASIQDIKKQVKHYLSWQGESRSGTVVLLDMGSLNQMFSEIRKISDQELLVVNNLTTATALDVGLRIQRGESFEQITEATQKYGNAMGSQFFEGISNRKNIIVSCMSGVGLSEEIKRMMKATLSGKIEVITEDYKELNVILRNNNRQFFKNTQFVLTTTDVRNDLGIQILNVYNIMDKEGHERLTQLLLRAGESHKSVDALMTELLKFFSINGIRNRLQFMNPDIVISDVQDILDRYQAYYDVNLEAKIQLNLYMHLSLMIERAILSSRSGGEPPSTHFEGHLEEDFYAISHSIFNQIETKYNIVVDDYEISLVFELLKPYIAKS